MPSALPEISRTPFGLNARLLTGVAWPLRSVIFEVVEKFHSQIDRSRLAEARQLPSGQNAMLVIAPSWPRMVLGMIVVGAVRFHKRITAPFPPEARNLPSGLKASADTRCTSCNSPTLIPELVSQKMMRASAPPVAKRVPSGLKATDNTEPK